MNRELARKIADAVLYEGYMLYPYRPSAIKNRQRWSFGILYPPAYAEVRDGTERCTMHSECLLESHRQRRAPAPASLPAPVPAAQVATDPATERFEPVPSLVVEGQRIESWDEGVERSVDFELTLPSLRNSFRSVFPAAAKPQLLRDGLRPVSRNRPPHPARNNRNHLGFLARVFAPGLLKLTVEVTNTTPFEHDPARPQPCPAALAALGAHHSHRQRRSVRLACWTRPKTLRDAASACTNLGNFPVLVGDPPRA